MEYRTGEGVALWRHAHHGFAGVNGEPGRGDQLGMRETGQEKSRNDPERHARVRARSIDELAFATGIVAVVHYNPDGVLMLIVFVGAYGLATLLWQVAWAASGAVLTWLSVLLFIATFSLAFVALPLLPALLMSLFLPGIAQAWLIWTLWPATATLWHPLTLFSVTWLIVLAIWLFERGPARLMATERRNAL